MRDRRLLLGRGGDWRSALPLLVSGDPYFSSPGRGCPTTGTPWHHQILLRGLDVLLHIEIVLDGGGRCTMAGPRKPALDPEPTPRLLAAPGPILGGVGSRRRCCCHQSSPPGKEGDAEMGGDGEKANGARLIRKTERPRLGNDGGAETGAGLGCFITCSLPFYQIKLKAETHRTHIHSTVEEKVLYELEVPGSIPEGDDIFCCLIFLLQFFYFEFLKYVLYVTAIIFRLDNLHNDSINIPLKLGLIFTKWDYTSRTRTNISRSSIGACVAAHMTL
jgi:hypothetical protein